MKYQLIEDTVLLENRRYTVYGIGCGALCIRDICCEKQRMLRLIALCNRLELAPCHLRDVVEDFLP